MQAMRVKRWLKPSYRLSAHSAIYAVPAIWRSPRTALPDRLEQHDPGRHRDVQAADVPPHRNRGQEVARLPHQPPQARPFGAQHDGGRHRQIDRVVAASSASPARPTVQTPSSFSSSSARAMLTTSAIRTCATAPADALAAAPPSAADRRVLDDHAVDAGRVGRPKDRAEVVRILDAVEHDDERRPRGAAHQVVDAVVRGARRRRRRRPGARRRAPARSSTSRVDALHRDAALGRASAEQFAACASPPRSPTRSAVTRPARSASRTGLMP